MINYLPATGDLRSVTEIVLGRAVIVVAEHDDGTIGIGNVVAGERWEPGRARRRCLDHATMRIAQMQRAKVGAR